MSALIPAANKINADTAGLTSLHTEPPTAQAASPTEVISHVVPSVHGELSYLFSDGLPTPVGTPIETPTGSTQGRLGGLVPTGVLSGVQPGPRLQAAATEARSTAESVVSRLRKTFGV